MANPDRIVVTKGTKGFYWRRQAENGRNVAIGGEPFSSEDAAMFAAHDLWHDQVFPVYRALSDGTYAFNCVVGPGDLLDDEGDDPDLAAQAQESGTVSAPLAPDVTHSPRGPEDPAVTAARHDAETSR